MPLYQFNDNPPSNSTDSASAQILMDTADNRRASFADANANHVLTYSRYHKSKFFCATCHDISNPVLYNLGADPTQPLPTVSGFPTGRYLNEASFPYLVGMLGRKRAVLGQHLGQDQHRDGVDAE